MPAPLSSSRPRRLPLARSPRVLGLALAFLVLLPARSAPAAELTAFLSDASPGWGTGAGGILTITLFNIVGAELEGAWQGGGERLDTSLSTLVGKAYLGPQFGSFVPYAGLMGGGYWQSLPIDDDRGTIGGVFVGAKLKFPMGLVVRAEYQWVDLPPAAPVAMDARYFVGLGLSF
jgi:hypothetical protein